MKGDNLSDVQIAVITEQLAKFVPLEIPMVQIKLCAYELIKNYNEIKSGFNPVLN